MRTIRASEISTYIYCRRVWWYRLHGIQPTNQEQLEAGINLHVRNARSLEASVRLRLVAMVILVLGVALAIVHFASPAF